ncbi:Zn-ribbon domain-containing OB-fold protein [Microbulbifer sp.]|uniref:Zn-ribbon domain-containing OB-fold protein n=1 Tax=Microbulbifer sp. TaxID=1908541 RepID=UPI003F2AC0FF
MQTNDGTAGLNFEQERFWQAAAEGVLLIPRCVDTGKYFFYPREKSPFTGGDTEWGEASGFGEIYSCSLSYRAKTPYCIAYVRLDEGPIMLTNILSDDLDSVAIGQRVRVVFEKDERGRPAPFFTPVAEVD